jgi:hypothetical protein
MSSDLPDLEPHGTLTPLFDDVWTLTGSVVMAPLLRLPRNMVVLRHEGELALVNSVRLSEQGLADLEALGTVRHVVRIGFHGMDDAFYVDRYGAELWALPGVEHARGATTQELGADHAPFPGITVFRFELTNKPEAALIVNEHGLLITCDSVQNWEDTEGCSLLAKGVTHLMGFVKPAQIGPPWRKIMTPEGGSLRPDFERLLELDWKHLVGGHGNPLRDEAREALRRSVAREF